MESSADYFLPLRLDIEYSICCPVTHKFFHSCVETDNIANCVSTSMLISSSFQRFISFRYFPFIYISFFFFFCLLELTSVSTYQGLCWALFSSSLPGSLQTPKGGKLDNCIMYLICFTSFRDHCPL